MSDTFREGGQEQGKKLMPFFPDYLLDEAIAWYIALAGLVVLASLFPAGLEEQADPLKTPAHIKPEWYFLFLYQTLKLVPRIVGALAPAVGLLILIALPFVDRSPQRSFRSRLALNIVCIATLVIVVALTLWGWLS